MAEIVPRQMRLKVDDSDYFITIDTYGNLYINNGNIYFELFVSRNDTPVFYKVHDTDIFDGIGKHKPTPNKLQPKQQLLHEKAADTVNDEIEYNVEDTLYKMKFTDEPNTEFVVYGEEIDLYEIDDIAAIYDTYIFHREKSLRTIIHSADNSSAYKLKIDLETGLICFRATSMNDVAYKLTRVADTIIALPV